MHTCIRREGVERARVCVGLDSHDNPRRLVVGCANLGPVVPAVAVGVDIRVIDVAVVAERVLITIFHEVVVGDEAEVVGVDAFADVLHHAVRIVRILELEEVVEAVGNDGARIGHVEELAGQLRREVLRPVGEAVVIEVGEEVCVCLDLVEVGDCVRDAHKALGRGLPRVGRRVAAIPFIDNPEAAAGCRRGVARVVVVERADRRGGEGGGCAVRAEHHVEFPAVEHAVAVVVRVVGHEREVGPVAVGVDVRLGAEAKRLEVADEEVLVERRERLGVHRVLNGHGGE